MFYAEFNRYGTGAITEFNGRVQSAGNLLRFKTRADRSAWVDEDVWDGNYHRESITRSHASAYHSGAFHAQAAWDEFNTYSTSPIAEQFIGVV